MDRRSFGTIAGAGIAGLFLPRKSEAQEPAIGTEGMKVPGGRLFFLDKILTHEEMAAAIADHPLNVVLRGNTNFFGKTRECDYANLEECQRLCNIEDGEWVDVGGPIYSYRSKRQAAGCQVRVFNFSICGRIYNEEYWDISNPKLKLIEYIGSEARRIPARHFARIGGRWTEV